MSDVLIGVLCVLSHLWVPLFSNNPVEEGTDGKKILPRALLVEVPADETAVLDVRDVGDDHSMEGAAVFEVITQGLFLPVLRTLNDIVPVL